MRVLALVLLSVGALSYLRDLSFEQEQLELPLRPLETGSDLTAAPALPARPGSLAGYDVLLVTLDATRPDRLGFYGNHEIETPNLDHMAQRGVVFSHALATASTTLPSHASILTGLYPYHHGARVNARFRLAPEQRTLAEILSEHGYRTAAFVSAYVLDARFGLAQGFDVYDADTSEAPATLGFAERRADVTTDRAIAWLREKARPPFFLWVHYFDPHVGYLPPEPFSSRSANPYDGEIAFVDRQLGRLVAAVESANPGHTLTVVTADHGEALGEHGEHHHGYLVQEATLRIPLLMYAPGAIRAGVHVDARVSQIDLTPTILSLLGVPLPEGLDGVDLSASPPPDRPIIAETLEGRVHYGWAALSAIYEGALKYVDGPSPELYDLSRDPLEHRDLAPAQRAEAATLRRRLHAMLGPEDLMLSEEPLDADAVARLRALGYLVSDHPEPGADGAPRSDPKEMLPQMNRVLELLAARDLAARLPLWQRAVAWLTGNSPPTTTAELIEALEALAAETPDFTPIYGILHSLYLEEGRPADARRAMERLGRTQDSG